MAHFTEFLSDENWARFWMEENQLLKTAQTWQMLEQHPSLGDTDTDELSPDYWDKTLSLPAEDDDGFPTYPMERATTVYAIEEMDLARHLEENILPPECILMLMKQPSYLSEDDS